MKVYSAALLLLAASLNAPSTAFQPSVSLVRNPTAIWAAEEDNVGTATAISEPAPDVAESAPKQSLTERMMAKAPQEGQ